jgi:hypothetical protein
MANEKCGYVMAGGEVCGERIYPDDASRSGWAHEHGDRERGMCHWASPIRYGPQDASAVVSTGSVAHKPS